MYNDMLLLLDTVIPRLQFYTYIHTYLIPIYTLRLHAILADHVSSHDTPEQSTNLSHWLWRPTPPRISGGPGPVRQRDFGTGLESIERIKVLPDCSRRERNIRGVAHRPSGVRGGGSLCDGCQSCILVVG